MAKLVSILLLGLVLEAIGVVYLSRGLKQMGEMRPVTVSEMARLVTHGATNPNVLLGVLFEAAFFACLLVLLSRAEVSLIWPLTALGFVFTTLAAKFILHEPISAVRWLGVLLIMVGAALVTHSEKVSVLPPDAPAPQPEVANPR